MEILERDAEIAEGFCFPWLEAQGLAAAGLGLLEAVEMSQRDAQRVVRPGKVRSEAHNLARQGDAVIVSTPLKTKYPEIVQRTHVVRVDLQDGSIELLCLVKLTLH